MHRRILAEFESIVRAKGGADGRVLEVGAVPTAASLLCMSALDDAREKVGINLDGPHSYRDFDILAGTGNDMQCFADASFDIVLCNAVLEHDKHFYRTVAEIRRVTRPGGHAVIGVPGFRACPRADRTRATLRRLPLVRTLRSGSHTNALFTATLTYKVHDAPGDYYRFSPQAVREVFFDGYGSIDVRSVMTPPRLIGVGTKL